MSENQYLSVGGTVAFEPENREVGGKQIRSVVLTPFGAGNVRRIYCTVWDQHAGIDINQGDFLLVNGKYTTNEGQSKDGDPVVYHNLSVSSLVVLAPQEASAEPVKKGRAAAKPKATTEAF